MQIQIPTREAVLDVRQRFDTVDKNVPVKEREMELQELRLRQQDPALWDDQERAVEITRKVSEAERFLSEYYALKESVEMCELWILEDEPDALIDLDCFGLMRTLLRGWILSTGWHGKLKIRQL